MKVDFICLANSRKLGGRCVAGIRTDIGDWIRPVSNSSSGTLSRRDYTLESGEEVAALDLVEAEVSVARPEPHQPENWILEETTWRLLEKINPSDALSKLTEFIEVSPSLFGSQGDRVDYASLKDVPAQASLALVEPTNISWVITDNVSGNRQSRARFNLGNMQYNLVVTDLKWRERLSHLGWGVHARNSAGLDSKNRLLFTVSLGEPFNGQCYKLVAAVIVIPG